MPAPTCGTQVPGMRQDVMLTSMHTVCRLGVAERCSAFLTPGHACNTPENLVVCTCLVAQGVVPARQLHAGQVALRVRAGGTTRMAAVRCASCLSAAQWACRQQCL